MPDRLRNKKKDNAKKTRDLYGNYSAKNVRMYEAQQEKRKEKNKTIKGQVIQPQDLANPQKNFQMH